MYNVLCNHLTQVIGIQKRVSEFGKLANVCIGGISPEKSLFEGLITIISVIPGVNTIADYEDLHILEQSMIRPE